MPLLTLPDGRELDYRVEGPPDGVPLGWYHGTPGSVLPIPARAAAAVARGLRFVTYSRAGYGISSRHRGRTVADVAADVEVLLDHLDAPRALTGGESGGGPHALATAALLPDRVAGALVVAGVGPFAADGLEFLAGMGEQNIDEFGAAVDGEASLRGYLEPEAAGLREADAADIVASMHTLLPEVDRAVLTDDLGVAHAANFAEALRVGVDGWLDDDLAFVTPWGFEPADVTVPVSLWQGSIDLMVPFAHGRWLAAALPHATAHLLDGEGHLSITAHHFDEMLVELTATL